MAGEGGIIGSLLDGRWIGRIVLSPEASGEWESGVRRYGRRCKVVDKEELRAQRAVWIR